MAMEASPDLNQPIRWSEGIDRDVHEGCIVTMNCDGNYTGDTYKNIDKGELLAAAVAGLPRLNTGRGAVDIICLQECGTSLNQVDKWIGRAIALLEEQSHGIWDYVLEQEEEKDRDRGGTQSNAILYNTDTYTTTAGISTNRKRGVGEFQKKFRLVYSKIKSSSTKSGFSTRHVACQLELKRDPAQDCDKLKLNIVSFHGIRNDHPSLGKVDNQVKMEVLEVYLKEIANYVDKTRIPTIIGGDFNFDLYKRRLALECHDACIWGVDGFASDHCVRNDRTMIDYFISIDSWKFEKSKRQDKYHLRAVNLNGTVDPKAHHDINSIRKLGLDHDPVFAPYQLNIFSSGDSQHRNKGLSQLPKNLQITDEMAWDLEHKLCKQFPRRSVNEVQQKHLNGLTRSKFDGWESQEFLIRELLRDELKNQFSPLVKLEPAGEETASNPLGHAEESINIVKFKEFVEGKMMNGLKDGVLGSVSVNKTNLKKLTDKNNENWKTTAILNYLKHKNEYSVPEKNHIILKAYQSDDTEWTQEECNNKINAFVAEIQNQRAIKAEKCAEELQSDPKKVLKILLGFHLVLGINIDSKGTVTANEISHETLANVSMDKMKRVIHPHLQKKPSFESKKQWIKFISQLKEKVEANANANAMPDSLDMFVKEVTLFIQGRIERYNPSHVYTTDYRILLLLFLCHQLTGTLILLYHPPDESSLRSLVLSPAEPLDQPSASTLSIDEATRGEISSDETVTNDDSVTDTFQPQPGRDKGEGYDTKTMKTVSPLPSPSSSPETQSSKADHLPNSDDERIQRVERFERIKPNILETLDKIHKRMMIEFPRRRVLSKKNLKALQEKKVKEGKGLLDELLGQRLDSRSKIYSDWKQHKERNSWYPYLHLYVYNYLITKANYDTGERKGFFARLASLGPSSTSGPKQSEKVPNQ